MSHHRWRIVVAEDFERPAVDRLLKVGDVETLDSCDESTLTQAVRKCDALLVRSRSRVTREVIEAADRLKVIGRAGVGLENIDLPTARKRGITVVYTPHAATAAVADLTVAMMLALVRRLGWAEKMFRTGRFTEARRRARARDMSELTVGIIGLGRIGSAVARRCRHGFGMRVIYSDIRDVGWTDFVAAPTPKDRLFGEADIVSLHVPLTEQTRHLIDDGALAKFRRGAILINTARGSVVDNIAVAAALESGQLGGAGLDVFDPEPLPADHPLLSAPNTVLVPHLGARTERGLAKMEDIVSDVVRVLTGERPHHPADL